MTSRQIANFIALFIPSKNLRHRLRAWKGFETNYDRIKKDLEYIKSFLQYSMQTTEAPPIQGIGREVQLIIAEALKKVADICDCNNIDYWLDYGTLLGAVRNKGFLPWDDDIDIAICWEDRERFIQAMKDNNLEVEVSHEGKGEIRVHAITTNCVPMHIDVFAYKATAPISAEGIKELDTQVMKCWNAHSYFNLKYHNQLLGIMDNIATQYKGDETVYVRALDSRLPTYHSPSIPKEAIFPLTTITYEGETYKAPRFYYEYLTLEYGDFMQWPPDFKINDIHERLSMQDKLSIISRMYNHK